jgi:hypothetical protein
VIYFWGLQTGFFQNDRTLLLLLLMLLQQSNRFYNYWKSPFIIILKSIFN